jgi:hypothetical protein
MEVNDELKQLIEQVKTSQESVQTVVNKYFQETGWSMLKDEFKKLSAKEKRLFYTKLKMERK